MIPQRKLSCTQYTSHGPSLNNTGLLTLVKMIAHRNGWSEKCKEKALKALHNMEQIDSKRISIYRSIGISTDEDQLCSVMTELKKAQDTLSKALLNAVREENAETKGASDEIRVKTKLEEITDDEMAGLVDEIIDENKVTPLSDDDGE